MQDLRASGAKGEELVSTLTMPHLSQILRFTQNDNVPSNVCVPLIVLPTDVRRIHTNQCVSYQVVNLRVSGEWSVARLNVIAAKLDPSVHLALSFAEWVRMTMASLIGGKKRNRV